MHPSAEDDYNHRSEAGPRRAVDWKPLPVHRSVSREADEYASAIKGVEIDAIRAGSGHRGTHVGTASSQRLVFSAGSVGFPMLSQTTVPDNHIMLAYVAAAPRGCRWCEIELAPDMVVAYSSAAEHTSRSLPGLEFSVIVAEEGPIAEAADTLGICYEMPPRGEVHQLANTKRTEPVRSQFLAFAELVAAGSAPSKQAYDELLRSMVHALSETDRIQRVGSTRRIDSRQLVRTCVDYAKSLGHIPSMGELCAATHVSERRLRTAFVTEFDVPPMRYFRLWALDQARRQLTNEVDGNLTVTDIASNLGLSHLSRFSHDYAKLHGESPSATRKRMVSQG